jgi:hypothetical protein
MREVLRAAPDTDESVVEEDGIFRISDRAYAAPSSGTRGELQTLATAVLGRPAALVGKRQSVKRRARITASGLDYDDYLDQFPKPLTDRIVFRSLIAVSQDISAVGVILLAEQNGRYEPLLNIGVDDVTLSRFRFPPDDPFSVDVLRKRKAAVLHRPIAEIDLLRGRVSADDAAYMKRTVFLPATYRGNEAFLLFAFARDRNIVLRDLLSALNGETVAHRPA